MSQVIIIYSIFNNIRNIVHLFKFFAVLLF